MSIRPIAAEPEAADSVIRAALREVQRAVQTVDLVRRIGWWLAGAAAAPLLVILADHVTPGGLPLAAMRAAGVSWAGGLLLAAGLLIWLSARRLPGLLYAAKRLEHLRGIEHNRVINTLLAPAACGDASVIAAATGDAERELLERPPLAGRTLGGDRRAWIALLAVLAGWILYAWIGPKPLWPSLLRMFGANIAAPTATRLALLRPDAGQVSYLGEPLPIEVEVAGRPVSDAWFERFAAPGDEREPLLRYRLLATRGAGERDIRALTLAPHETAGEIYYRIQGGDAELRGVITLQAKPELVDLSVNLTPPAYTAQPPRQTRETQIETWQNTAAEFILNANTPIRDPLFVLNAPDGEQRTRMVVDPDEPRRARVQFPLRRGGDYWVEFRDAWGRANEPAPRRRLIVRVDEPPRVEFTRPAADEAPDGRLELADTPWLRISASDDVLLASLDLVLDRRGVVSRRTLLGAAALANRPTADFSVTTAELGLEIGETVRVWAEALDNRHDLDGRPAAQVGRSRTLEITFSKPFVPPPAAPELVIPSEGGPGDAPGERSGVAGDGGAGDGSGGESTGDGEPGDGTGRGASSQPGSGPALEGEGRGDGAAGGQGEGEPGFGEGPNPPGDASEPPGDGQPGSTSRPASQPDPGGANRAAGPGGGSDGARDLAEELEDFLRENQETLEDLRERENPPAGEPRESPTSAPGTTDPQPPPESPEPPASQPAEEPDPQPPEPTPAEPEPNPADDDPRNPTPRPNPPASQPGPASQPDEPQSQPSDSSEQPEPAPPTEPPPDAPPSPPTDTPAPPPDAPPEGSEEPATPDEPVEPQPADNDAPDAPEDSTPTDPENPNPDSPQIPPTLPRPGEEAEQPSEAPQEIEGAPDAPPAPEPEINPDIADEPPAGMLEELEQVLDLLTQDDVAVDAELARLGLGQEARRRFTERRERRRVSAREAGVLGEARTWLAQQVEEGTIRTGVGGELGGLSGGAEAGDPRARLEQIRRPREQSVPPELEAVLDAYYEALARRSRPPE